MTITCTVRPMQYEDIASVLAIQAVCYTAIVPESRESLEAKLHASPSTCFFALANDQAAGYLVAVPWTFSSPPELDAPDCRLPAHPDCLYLHDLAVAPGARKTGAGLALVSAFMTCLNELRLPRACLIAIQASAPYWQRYGFRPAATSDGLQGKILTYGDSAVYMECLA